MHCPYCQSQVCEDSTACPRCGLTMEKAGAYFGTVPRLLQDVSDSGGVLRPAEMRRLRQRIAAFGRRFPQSGFSVAFLPLPKDTPGGTYTYWLFNRCNPAGEMNQGCANRHLFLLVDTAGRGAWMTMGYGLEPFVSTQLLQRCLDTAQPYFAQNQYFAGVSAVLAEAEALLREVVSVLPRMFGLERIEFARADHPGEPASVW